MTMTEQRSAQRPDPMTDLRLVNIPAPDPSPKPDRNAEKHLQNAPYKYYMWEYLGAIAAWGHISSEILDVLSSKVPEEHREETLELMWRAGYLRRYTDCPSCRSIQIWSLKAGQPLSRAVNTQPFSHQQGFYGLLDIEDESPTGLGPPEALAKHDLAAAELACRLSECLPPGWILGARDSKCSALLRLPKPARRDTAWRQERKKDCIERWADLVYVRKSDGLRIAIEVTYKQNKHQLAGKARWWGVSIAERGGYEKAGLRVVILDPPGKSIAEQGILAAFPGEHGWDKYREDAHGSVLCAKWEEWVDGGITPAGENGWLAYQPHSGKKKTSVRLVSLEGSGPEWAEGVKEAVDSKKVKGVFDF